MTPIETGWGECVICDSPIWRDETGEWWHDNPDEAQAGDFPHAARREVHS